MYSVFTFYVISFITAAAIVVPCLSTLVSDHGEPLLYSYLLKKLTNQILILYMM